MGACERRRREGGERAETSNLLDPFRRSSGVSPIAQGRREGGGGSHLKPCTRKRSTHGVWGVRLCGAGGDHLSPHFTKLDSLRSKGRALADNHSLKRDNLRLPLVQLGLRLSNLSQPGVPDVGRALCTPGKGTNAALASWALGPRLGLVVHGPGSIVDLCSAGPAECADLPNEAGVEEGGEGRRREARRRPKKLRFIGRNSRALAHPSPLPLSCAG
jgi:hypothetical protein